MRVIGIATGFTLDKPSHILHINTMTQTQKKQADSAAPDSSNLQSFNADVARLLDIVANALYTNHDVFLRELISNAADACDKLRYAAIEKPELISGDGEYRIHITRDTDTRTLTLIDNGVGMTKAEMADHLGTIAKSGTAKLMDSLKQNKDSGDNLKLIGQFGVGFYASYMVADTVTVISRKAGGKSTNVWQSDGRTGFTTRAATAAEAAVLDGERGTAVVLNIKDEGSDFLILEKIESTIKDYSDHIDIPVYMVAPNDRNDADRAVNQASALWTRNKSNISDEDYTAFYKHISHGFDEPLMRSHWHAEGVIDFHALMFIPTMRPFDLFEPGRKDAVKLYVRRVFISDSNDGLMYPWLRFVRGVIDSADLPLNISRDSLQYNPIITKIRTSVTKRILNDLHKLSQNDEAAFLTFWGQFGAALKEGLYDAPTHREAIFKICRFQSTHGEDEAYTDLAGYVERMKPDQDKIYYISGENVNTLRNSPQIEGFKARGVEVLFLTDTIDDFWLQNVSDFDGKTFQSVTKGASELDKFDDASDKVDDKPDDAAPNHDDLLKAMKEVIGDDIEDVRISNRLTDSPVCLVASDKGVDMHMERILKIHQKYDGGESKPVLEINPKHALIQKLGTLDSGSDDFKDSALLLMDQAKIIQGEPVSNLSDFTRRMSEFMQRGLN
jgi:molecular chaperone HtpG